jgi:uncharacterized protein
MLARSCVPDVMRSFWRPRSTSAAKKGCWLVQVHAVNAWADLEQALAPDGAVAGLEAAREKGWLRFIGITGHARPELLAHALYQYRFDTVLSALGMADHLVTSPDRMLLPVAQEHNTGVIAMKVLGHGTSPQIERAMRYSLGLPGVSLAIVGMDNVEQIDQNVAIAALFRPLDEQERAPVKSHCAVPTHSSTLSSTIAT